MQQDISSEFAKFSLDLTNRQEKVTVFVFHVHLDCVFLFKLIFHYFLKVMFDLLDLILRDTLVFSFLFNYEI